MDAPRRFALIPAAGSGTRFGGGLPKQYAPLSGVPLVRRTIDALNDSVVLEAVFVVLAPTTSFTPSASEQSAAWKRCIAADRLEANR